MARVRRSGEFYGPAGPTPLLHFHSSDPSDVVRIQGSHPSLVSVDVFAEIQDMLTARRPSTTHPRGRFQPVIVERPGKGSR